MISPQLLHHVRNGGIVAYPTSTLPGLACLPEARSLDALFELKQRPSDKPVSLGVLSLEQATNLAKSMVTKWGMTDKVGPVSIGDNAVISGQQRELIDSEVRRLCQVCYLPCWV